MMSVAGSGRFTSGHGISPSSAGGACLACEAGVLLLIQQAGQLMLDCQIWDASWLQAWMTLCSCTLYTVCEWPHLVPGCWAPNSRHTAAFTCAYKHMCTTPKGAIPRDVIPLPMRVTTAHIVDYITTCCCQYVLCVQVPSTAS